MRLKGEKKIEKIFKEGKSVFVFPVKAVFLFPNDSCNRANFSYGVSVSKRNFKKAVDRNRIKRQMREAVRLNQKNNLIDSKFCTAIMYIYIGKELMEYHVIETAIRKINRKVFILQ
jgi:ribonuclease P protein component